MSKQLSELLEDQKRRIYREFLKGRQVPSLAKKYDIAEDVVWEIVGLYAKKKHPNDVGNSGLGPADLLVSRLDSGGDATENPVVARNPRDLLVTHEQVVEEFDYDSPVEKLRLAGQDVHNLTAQMAHDEEQARLKAAKDKIAENAESTDAIRDELNKKSDEGFVKMKDEAIKKIKSQPTAEERAQAAADAAEAARLADVGAELARAEALKELASTEVDAEAAKALKESEAKAVEAMNKAREDANKAAVEQLKEAVKAAPSAVPSAPVAPPVDAEPNASPKVAETAQEVIDAHPKDQVIPQDVVVKLKAHPEKMFEVESVTTTQRPPEPELTLDTQPPVNPVTPEETVQQHAASEAPSVEAGGQVGQVTVHIQNNTGE